MEEILLSALAEAVFSVIVEDFAKNPKLESLRRRLQGNPPEQQAFERALRKAYLSFEKKFSDLANSLFDEHFIRKDKVVDELSNVLIPGRQPDVELLTRYWKEQLGSERSGQWDLSKPISFFINSLQDEVKGEKDLKPYVDSQSLNQLYDIASETRKQTELLAVCRRSEFLRTQIISV